MLFEVLGPVRILSSEGALALSGSTPRTLLSLLLLARGKVVSTERLMGAVWDDDLPPTARDSLQSHVSRLRRLISRDADGATRLVRQGGGYALHTAPDAIDAHRFRDLCSRALDDAVTLDECERLLGEALRLWRGSPLAGTLDTAWVRTEIAALENLRLAALEARFDAALALGRHRGVVADLETVAAREPTRERFHAQLMVALYRCGRQIEALGAYQRVRCYLVEEHGVEPGDELQDLQHRLLTRDHTLRAPAALWPGSGAAVGAPVEQELTPLAHGDQ